MFSVFVHDFPFSLNEERFKIQTCQISDQGENQRYAKQTIKKRKYVSFLRQSGKNRSEKGNLKTKYKLKMDVKYFATSM